MPSFDTLWTYFSGSHETSTPKVLEKANLPSLAKYIKSDACKNVFIMSGAGISTSAGIPDFRSPETGLYHNLARLNLPDPQAVFEIEFFRENPIPFYTLAHELAPGRFRPTPTHSFVRLLAEKGVLHTCFTQNIDTLERRAGVPANKIIEAHGSFATQHCIDCDAAYPDDKIKQHIKEQKIPRCEMPRCRGLVKPDIVFFGEALPTAFHRGVRSLADADLLIVMGTSLTVHPFASLVDMVSKDCPRVLINLDLVGNFKRPDDLVCLGKCDDVVRDLCRELGWEDELDRLWAETASTVQEGPAAHQEKPKEATAVKVDAEEQEKTQAEAEAENKSKGDELVNAKAEVEKLAEEIGKALQISPEAASSLMEPVSEKVAPAANDASDEPKDASSGGKL